jgi:hypothetical protein
MNNSTSKEATEVLVLPAYTKEEIIILFEKVLYDFNSIDNRVGKTLSTNNNDIESISDVERKLIEANNNLMRYSETRNKIIEDLLRILKN